jgi:hypothetical protein
VFSYIENKIPEKSVSFTAKETAEVTSIWRALVYEDNLSETTCAGYLSVSISSYKNESIVLG